MTQYWQLPLSRCYTHKCWMGPVGWGDNFAKTLMCILICIFSLPFRLNPAPGSYPIQSYPSSPPPAFPAMQIQPPNHQIPGLWAQHPPGHTHTPAPNQPIAGFGEQCLLNHYPLPPVGSFPLPSHRLGEQHLHPSRTDGSVASVPQGLGFPASVAASGSAELSQVRTN